MKGFTTILVCSLAALVAASPARNERPKGKGASVNSESEPTHANRTGNGEVRRGRTTIVMKEVGGIPGNECLTFRNNGEMVDAACVNTAADRQVTPSTSASGADVLLVQRSFTAGFRQDLVGVQACVGLVGPIMKAVDCAGKDELFSLVGGQLKTPSGACQSGHNDKAQLTVDPTGKKCAELTTTDVKPAAPIQ